MSPAAWLCVFLLVGLVSTPTHGLGLDRREEDDANQSVRDEISQLNSQYEQYLNDKDVASLMTFYADDIVVMPSGQPSFQGKEGLEASLDWVHYFHSMHFEIKEIEPLDSDAVYVFERYHSDVADENGNVVVEGKGVSIWKKTEQGYKIYISIFNQNN